MVCDSKPEEKIYNPCVVVDINATDPVGYEEYKKLALPAVDLHGGKYIVHCRRTETLEGDWTPSRLVTLHFESV